MKLIDIIVGYDYDCSPNVIEREDIEKYEKIIKQPFGPMIKNYILNYGYLGLDSIEFYGITTSQKENSDLITQTLYLHKTYDTTKNYIAFENLGDGVYTLLDSNDMTYKFISETNKLIPFNMNLYDYIADRFDGDL